LSWVKIPLDCVVREISEELAGKLTQTALDLLAYHIRRAATVVIVTYGCYVRSTEPPVVSNEHKRAGLFTADQVPQLVMPDGYKRSVATLVCRLGSEQQPGQ